MIFLRSFCSLLVIAIIAITQTRAAETPDLVRPKLSDPQIRRMVSGHWTNLQKGFQGRLVYAPDGTSSCELVPVDFLTKMLLSTYSFEGTWQIKDGLLYTKVKKSSTKNFPIGATYRDEILELTPESMTLRNQKQLITRLSRVK